MKDIQKTIDIDNLPVVALVGRVNVGKSTLFNTLTEEQKAIVSDIPGTTRTSNVGIVLWRGKYMRVVDTGGLTFTDDIPLEADILKQTERALKDADIILFVTDARDGVLPQERELARRLRRVEVKPVLLIANKTDNKKIEQTLTDEQWFKLGLGEPFPISATNGRNVGDLLDKIYTILHAGTVRPKIKKENTDDIRVSIIGKPNAGKSSLFNKLIGEERVIVSDIAHTTREPYDTRVVYTRKEKGKKKETQPIVFVDTAGIRRKAKVSGVLERAGIHKSIQAIEDADIVLFVLDGSQPISSQDMQLGGLVERRGKSVMILLNKWDRAEDTDDSVRNNVKKMVYAHFPHLKFAPILFVSGLTGAGVHRVFPTLVRIWQARQTEIPSSALGVFLKKATSEHRPSRGKGTRHPKLLGMKQLGTAPPVFQVYVKYRTSLHRSYIHYLENKLRDQFDFFGTPIIIKLKKMKK